VTGICEVCKKPGKIRHFPGDLPYTGCWCDTCYDRTADWAWWYELRAQWPVLWPQLLVFGGFMLMLGIFVVSQLLR